MEKFVQHSNGDESDMIWLSRRASSCSAIVYFYTHTVYFLIYDANIVWRNVVSRSTWKLVHS